MSDMVLLAVVGVLAMVVKEYFDRARNRDTAAALAAKVVAEAAAVRDRVVAAAAVVGEKMDGIRKVTDLNHDLANSAKDALEAKIEALQKTVEGLLVERARKEGKS